MRTLPISHRLQQPQEPNEMNEEPDPFLQWWTSIDTSNYSHNRDLARDAWNAAGDYFCGGGPPTDPPDTLITTLNEEPK